MSRDSMSGLTGDEHRTERRKRFSPVADRIEDDVLREIRFFAKKNDFDRHGHRVDVGGDSREQRARAFETLTKIETAGPPFARIPAV
eukprot:scaffold90231_cov54-Attheya_sp.AAC.3